MHHIERKSIDAPDYNDINNLTVLCRSCHMSLHRKAGHILTRGGRRGKGMSPIYCKENGCDRLQHAKGYCNKHYEHKRIYQLSTATH